MRRVIIAALGLLGLSASPSLAPREDASAQETFAFVGITLLRGDAWELEHDQTVVVRAGRIERVGPRRNVRLRGDEVRIEFPEGAVLLPGLTDAHVHLEGRPEEWLGLFLAHGVTTVFNLRGDSSHLSLRDAVRTGRLAGPTIYTAGGYANLPEVSGPAVAESLARAQRMAGYDFVKIHGDLSVESYLALASAAGREGMPLIGHLPRNLPLAAMLANPMHMIAHAEEFLYVLPNRATEPEMVRGAANDLANAGIWLTPTLAVFDAIGRQVARPDVVETALGDSSLALPAGLVRFWRSGLYTQRSSALGVRLRQDLIAVRAMSREAHGAGVRLLAGTDTPLPLMAPGRSLVDELVAMVEAGIPPRVALSAATVEAGAFARRVIGDSIGFGRLAVGERADLVLVSASPLPDFASLRRPLGVAAAGRWYDRKVLDSLLAPHRCGSSRDANPLRTCRVGSGQ